MIHHIFHLLCQKNNTFCRKNTTKRKIIVDLRGKCGIMNT